MFSVSEYQSRFYTSELKPINHDPEVLLKTQNLDPLYEENSLMYIFSKKDFLQNRNRINKESRPFITPKLESIDIDTEDDWLLSTKLVQNLIK